MAKAPRALLTVYGIEHGSNLYTLGGYKRYHDDVYLALEEAKNHVGIDRWVIVEAGKDTFMSLRDSDFKNVTSEMAKNPDGGTLGIFLRWDKLFPRENPSLVDFPSAEDLIDELLGRLGQRLSNSADPSREEILSVFSIQEIEDFIQYAKEAVETLPPDATSRISSQWVKRRAGPLDPGPRLHRIYLNQFGNDVYLFVLNPREVMAGMNECHRAQMTVRESRADDFRMSPDWREHEPGESFGAGTEAYPVFEYTRVPPWEEVRDNPFLSEFPSVEDMIEDFVRGLHGPQRTFDAQLRRELLEDFSKEDIQEFLEYAADANNALPVVTGKVHTEWYNGSHMLLQGGDMVIVFRIRGRRSRRASISIDAYKPDDVDAMRSAPGWEEVETGRDWLFFEYTNRPPPWETREPFTNPEELGPNELFDELVAQVGFTRPPHLVVDEKRALAGRKPGTARAFAATAGDGETVYVSPRLYDQSYDRYAAILMHELAHAWLLSYKEDHTEREADTKAEELFGHKIRYDKEDVQTLGPGTSPRPKRLK